MTTPAAAAEIRSFAPVIPAGTPQSAPVTVNLAFPPRLVQAVTWQVPPGPSGLMGWRLTMSGGNAVIPVGGGWIVADNRSGSWPLTGMPDSGAWELTGYNTDVYDHAVYLEFLLGLIPVPAATVQLATPAALSPVPDAAAFTPAAAAAP